jgi:hypothetical protein
MGWGTQDEGGLGVCGAGAGADLEVVPGLDGVRRGVRGPVRELDRRVAVAPLPRRRRGSEQRFGGGGGGGAPPGVSRRGVAGPSDGAALGGGEGRSGARVEESLGEGEGRVGARDGRGRPC